MPEENRPSQSAPERPAAGAPTEAMSSPESSAQAEPQQIGPYRILERIGEGGMGVIYKAEQRHPVRRMVALKIIRLGMDTEQVVARFEAERQALTMMDHPGIARVLDAGATEGGRPYFVMELVKGVPITEYCDSNNLPTRARLELFVQVCRAVHHAHQRGIIHRDIKPSNILVTLRDGAPAPKVIDFGIAKATQGRLVDRTLFTELRQWMGTPEYMSPEQAEMSGLDIDARSDIYSLGVLLYELLTGTTPFDPRQLRSASYVEIQRIIRELDPPKPSTRLSTLMTADVPLDPAGNSVTREGAVEEIARHRRTNPSVLSRSLRGEIDWIVMKAIEKDRTRRYETAAAMAADIERYMRDEPVLAGPPTATYRLRKAVRRYKLALLVTAVIAAALLFGFTAATIGFVKAQGLAGELQAALDDATQARGAAERAQHEADRLRANIQQELVRHLFDSREWKKAAETLNNLVSDAPENWELRRDLASALLMLGRPEIALEHLDLAVTLAPGDPQPLIARAALYAPRGRFREAADDFEQAISLQPDEALLSPTMRELALAMIAYRDRRYPAAVAILERLRDAPETPSRLEAAAHCFLALCLHGLGNPDEAFKAYERGMALLRDEMPGMERNLRPEVQEWLIARAAARRVEAMLAHFDAFAEELERLTAAIEAEPDKAVRYHDRGNFLIRLGRYQEALNDYLRARELQPENHHCWYFSIPLRLQVNDVDAYHQDCQQMVILFSPPPRSDIAERTAKACLLDARSDADDFVIQGLLAIAEGPNPGYLRPWVDLPRGMAHYRAGRFTEAINTLKKSRDDMPPDWPLGRHAANTYLAMAMHQVGDTEEARNLLRRLDRLDIPPSPALSEPELKEWQELNDLTTDLVNWLICRIALREADALIGMEAISAE